MADEERDQAEAQTEDQNQQPDEEEDDEPLPEQLEFSLELKEIPLKLKHKDGTTHDYVIRQFDGSERESVMNDLNQRTRYSPDGKPLGIKDYKGVHSVLLCKCIISKDTGKAITPAFVNSWPPNVQTKIYKTCFKLCGLDEKAKTRAKKDSGKES